MLPYAWLEEKPAHDRNAVIIGGGPSLLECKGELLEDRQQGYDFFAVSNAPAWLLENGIGFNAHVMCNAAKEHVAFVPKNPVACYYASTCHPSVLAKAAERLVLWRSDYEGIATALTSDSSTGLRAIHLAYQLGYRNFHLYGLDSCCIDGMHHAYPQPESEGDRVFTIELHGRRFHATRWMLKQAEEFVLLADALLRRGCFIRIHGDNLLHFLASNAQPQAG